MKYLALIALVSFTASANFPSMPTGNVSGQDRFKSKSGRTCDQAVATGKSFNAGIYGAKDDRNYGYYDFNRDYHNNQNDYGVYAGLTIQFGGNDRINCKAMFEKDMVLMDLEVKQAQAQHEITLKQLQAENQRLLNLLNNKTHFSE